MQADFFGGYTCRVCKFVADASVGVCVLHGLVISEDGGFFVCDGAQFNCKLSTSISEWHICSHQFGTSKWGERHCNPQYQQSNSARHFCSPNAEYESFACRMLSRFNFVAVEHGEMLKCDTALLLHSHVFCSLVANSDRGCCHAMLGF